MRQFPLFGVLLLVPALALVLLTGCPGTPPPPATSPPVKTGGDKTDAGKAEKITAPTDGTVTGVVHFDGEVPKAVVEAAIANHKTDKEKCMAGGGNHILEQKWLVSAKGGVANVVISLAPAEGKEYDVSAELKAKWEKRQFILDQPFCAYTPHVVTLYAGVQPLLVKNTAAFPHNVKINGGIKNGDFDSGNMAPNSELKPMTFKHDTKPITMQCSLHGWMTGKIVTFQHPYFATTKEDGSFEILDVPSGVELRVFMWHESFEKAKQVGTVTAKAGAKTSIESDKLKIK
ncbi:MAG: hypothetical protein EXR98_10360 [Gemmataceae bacterium]|nr:hypothetical protein [Gemmataceae bacterium]